MVRHHDADVLGQLSVLVKREHVGCVVVLGDCRFDLGTSGRLDRLWVVEIFGDGRPRDSAGFCELLHVFEFANHRISVA